MTTEPDPKTVREIAREFLLDDSLGPDELDYAVRAHTGYTFPAEDFQAWRDAVDADVQNATVTKAASWPDELAAAGRPAADLAHAAEDVREHLAPRARAVNDEVLRSPEVISVARADGHSHALMETVLRTLLAERDALAAHVDARNTGNDSSEAADAAARLRAWFKAEGPLVMDEADLDDVQSVLGENDVLRARVAELEAHPWIVVTPTEAEQPQGDETQHARTFLAGLRENITSYHQPLPGQPEHCTCGGASGCDRGADDLAAIATLDAALNAAVPQYFVDGQPVDRESYEAWVDEGRATAGIDYDERDYDEDGGPF